MNIEQIKHVIRAAAVADDTVIIEGLHGLGKSDSVKQIAEEDGYHLEVLFLSTQDTGDLVGIPHLVEMNGESVTTWSVPVWLNRMNEAQKAGKRCILFLDELNRAPLDIRQASMQLVLERQIHEHSLPTVNGQRTIVVAAINPSDSYQVEEMDPALMDRFLHCTVEPDAESWLKWARKAEVNQIVRDFLSEHPNRLHWTPEDEGIGCTPRSWAKLGCFMNNVKDIPEDVLFQIMKGKVGTEIASQFYSFYKNYAKVVKLEDIVSIVEVNKSKVLNVEDLSDLVKVIIKDQEAVQKTELAHQIEQFASKNNHDKDSELVLLTYLYALEVETCVAFLKELRATDTDSYMKLAALDDELNDKNLFKRIVQAASRE